MGAPGADLLALQHDVEAQARDAGLDVPDIRYEVVDHRELNEIAAYGGFPVRYSHWRFGMEFDRLIKGHAWGLQRIYELVINTEPVVAYLLQQNSPVEQKLVMAHVCGHADFFRRNAWFRHTDLDMIDRMATHAARIRSLSDQVGEEPVEAFIDQVLSLDNLIDAGAMARARGRPGNAPPLEGEAAPGDILGHLLRQAPLAHWQQEILAMLRDEAYYFLPQLLTKVMNEGWASFWHSRLMTGTLLRDAEVVDYACQHAGAMGGTEGPMNPYRLGLELYRHIEARAPSQPEQLFEARLLHNDLTFVDNFLDLEFCRAHGMGRSEEECEAARESLLAALTNAGQPVIRRRPSSASDLELEHVWSGSELQLDQAEETLRNLQRLWAGTVRLHSRLDRRSVLLTCTAAGITKESGEPTGEPARGRRT
ncbi:MAG: SpoVR family protein [Planctomycetota bacterium]